MKRRIIESFWSPVSATLELFRSSAPTPAQRLWERLRQSISKELIRKWRRFHHQKRRNNSTTSTVTVKKFFCPSKIIPRRSLATTPATVPHRGLAEARPSQCGQRGRCPSHAACAQADVKRAGLEAPLLGNRHGFRARYPLRLCCSVRDIIPHRGRATVPHRGLAEARPPSF